MQRSQTESSETTRRKARLNVRLRGFRAGAAGLFAAYGALAVILPSFGLAATQDCGVQAGSSSSPEAASTPQSQEDNHLGLLLDLLEDPEVQTEAIEASGGNCEVVFNLEAAGSGDLGIEAITGDSGDAFGGDAFGGDSGASGVGGSAVTAGDGGPGGSAGGSGAYAGAVIGNFSSGGGGNGGNGGLANCSAGPVAPGGRACTGGDAAAISGDGGWAFGGDAQSGDSGEIDAAGNQSGRGGENTAR